MEQYRFSRLSSFSKCPRKHFYEYVENIKSPGNEYTLPGTIFHNLLEGHYTGNQETIDKALTEYSHLIASGTLEMPPDLMSTLLPLYTGYYKDEDAKEEAIAIEFNHISDLEDGDTISATIDKVVELDDGTYVIRDTKTTTKELKYSPDDVRYNQQLLWYTMVAEEHFGIVINALEIDEVRLAKLQPTPLNQNGKPTIDKKRLGLVTYEDYLYTLQTMGLDTAPEYKAALDYLEKRGHPLFRRTRVQLLDRGVIEANADDLLDMYHAIKKKINYRVRGPLCNYCTYKDLCNLDMFAPGEEDRKIFKQKITKTFDTE